jgi:hypothetical protein
MRTSSRGVAQTSACMSIAVIGSSGRVAVAAARFTKAGMVSIPDTLMLRRSPGCGAVLHVARSDSHHELAEFGVAASNFSATSRSQLATRTALRKQAGAFQPVWTIHPVMRPLGFEVLAIDDDATEQLEVFYAALAGDRMLGGARRSHITINPRGGWHGYGHPDVTRRG